MLWHKVYKEALYWKTSNDSIFYPVSVFISHDIFAKTLNLPTQSGYLYSCYTWPLVILLDITFTYTYSSKELPFISFSENHLVKKSINLVDSRNGDIITYSNSRSEVLCKKGVNKNFTKLTGKHLSQNLKLQAWDLQIYLKRDSGADTFLWVLQNF